MSTIEDTIRQLPPDIRVNGQIFIDSLMEKRREHPVKPLRQDWAGGFSDFTSQYISIDLQKKALEWRGD